MSNPLAVVTEKMDFYQAISPHELVAKYGSPLYVYNERILRERCRQMRNLLCYPKFTVSYSAKANSNLHLLEIVREEGLNVDAMSAGEIFIQRKAGFQPEQIFFVCNNVSGEELQYAIDNNVTVSVDSLAQLETFGRINPGGKVAIRFNPGVGTGHDEKVVTGGKKTKFGVNSDCIDEVKGILQQYELKLVGINQHIGSLFMEGTKYLESIQSLLTIAEQFDDLEFIDMGGGFGIPYHKAQGQEPLELKELGAQIDKLLFDWTKKHGREIEFQIEPGRFIPAECGLILGTVHATKYNSGKKFIGTDIGFNVLARPVMYDSHHDIEFYPKGMQTEAIEEATIVGNICESGDILAKRVMVPQLVEGDLIGVMDAGAYGFVMASNYNSRLKPAEILIRENGEIQVIRRRDTYEDLARNF